MKSLLIFFSPSHFHVTVLASQIGMFFGFSSQNILFFYTVA